MGRTVVFAMVLIGALSESAPAQPSPVRILAVGRSLGHFHEPTPQLQTLVSCPTDAEWYDVDAILFRDAVRQARTPDKPTLTLSVGENFSPEFLARRIQQVPAPPSGSAFIGKDRMVWDWVKGKWLRHDDKPRPNPDVTQSVLDDIAVGKGYISADNVACVFMGAGFDAVVPGKHDFYFGPERLRMIARLMATPALGYPGASSTTLPGPVQMLAGNLVIRTSFRDAHEPLPDSYKDLKFGTSNTKIQPGSLKDGDALLPYTRTFRFTAPTEIAVRASLWSNDTRDPDALKKIHDLPTKWDPPSPDSPDKRSLVVSLPRQFELSAGLNYAVCLEGTGGGTEPYCTRFTVDFPFFQYPNPNPKRVDASGGQCYNDPQPFFVKWENGKAVAVVFAAVDPRLREHVGELNFLWANGDAGKRYKTEVVVVEPARALNQLLEYFDHWYEGQQCAQSPDYERCAAGLEKFSGIKILMAQMRTSQARELAARVKGSPFNVVISEAEQERATPNQTIVYDPMTAPAHPTFLLVPRPAYDEAEKRPYVQLRQLTVARLPSGQHHYKVEGAPMATAAALQRACDQPAFADRVAQAWGIVSARIKSSAPPLTCEEKFQLLTLYAVRNDAKADIALLQKRDFFFYTKPGASFHDIVSRILWKGDFRMKLLATGSTLKSVIKHGAEFEAQEREAVSLEVERGRGLVMLGITYDAATKEYLVNGRTLDDKRLYTVATSDYIALGDTGFPDLATPPVGRPLLPQDLDWLYPIDEVVTYAFDANMDPRGHPRGIFAKTYIDELPEQPSDTRAGLTYAVRFRRWFRPDNNAAVFEKMQPPERVVQERTERFVSLQKALGSVSGLQNNVSEDVRETQFAGVSPPQVEAKSNVEFRIENQTRAGFIGRNWETFLADDLAFSRKSTARKQSSPLVNRPDNRLAIEGGLFRRFNRKSVPRFGPQISVRADTQLRPPFQTFELASPDGSKMSVDLQHERTTNLSPRAGFRIENRKSSIVIGYERSIAQRIDRYDFTGPFGALVCDSEKLKACLQGAGALPSGVSVHRTRLGRHGFFGEGKLVIPSAARVSFESQHSLERFLAEPDDNRTMTRWRYLISNALKVKITQKVSVEPTVDLFFFRNQADPVTPGQNQPGLKFFGQWKGSIGMNYSFDWFSGNPVAGAMQNGNQKTP